MYPKEGGSDMSGFVDNTYVLLAQVAQMMKALGEKGWGRRELTLLGKASPAQLEQVRAVLQGRMSLVPIVRRWWREGDDIVIPYPNEDRSGAELLLQDLGRFGEKASRLAKQLLSKVDRIKGEGEFVIVRCPYIGGTYEAVLQQLLESRPDLERAPQAAVLQLTATDVHEIGVVIVVASVPVSDDPVPIVFQWAPMLGLTVPLSVRDCGHHKAGWWNVNDNQIHFLLKRK